MRKYTKKQREAIDGLLTMLDELENKPRRLYYELENLAFVFGKDDAVPSIREAQDLMYSHINEGETYQELFTSLRKFKHSEWEWQIKNSPETVETSQERIKGAEEFIKFHIKELTERRFY